jgi:ribonucleoside-diphosphate reductase alpha chain
MTPGSFDPKLKPTGCNPCGEQALANYNNCLLSALVLHKYVIDPYKESAVFSIGTFLSDIKYGVIFLDTLVDLNIIRHPLKEQQEADEYGRRIGQEFTGLGDCLAMLGLEYGSSESIEFIDYILYLKASTEFKTSIQLAKEKGPAPCFKTKKQRELYLKQEYIQKLIGYIATITDENIQNKISNYDDYTLDKKEIIEQIMEYGLRNSAFNTVGPTGTISIIADNCTSGIEPLFAIDYFREVRLQAKGNQTEKTRIVHFPLLKHIGPEVLTMDNKDIIKKYHYVPTHSLDYKKRIKVQAAVQKWTDSSVSSTLNLNKDATIEDIYDVYIKGHEAKLKGMTIFRDGCKKGILTTSCDFDSEEGANIIDIEKYLLKLKEKINEPQRSYRYVEYWKKAKIYLSVTINDKGQPIEIFSNVPYEAGIDESGQYSTALYMERTSYWHSTCRLTSLLLRAGVPIYMICNQLRKSSPSMVDLTAVILRVLSKYNTPTEEKINKIKTTGEGGDYCVACKKNGVAYIGGCGVCQICGDTKCG